MLCRGMGIQDIAEIEEISFHLIYLNDILYNAKKPTISLQLFRDR